MKKIHFLDAMYGVFFVTLLSGVAVTNCVASKVACQIIKTADDACTVIELMGADGKPVQVPVTKEELQGFAKMSAARRDAEKKAGVQMGAPIPADQK